MSKLANLDWTLRLKASGVHLLISLGVAALAATLVFAIWYPYPYRVISGGRELFLILVTVDVLLGPLITLSVFNLKKPSRTLKKDLAVVGLLQVAALVYGLWTMSLARPVHLVFEIDRFRVVHAVDVPLEELSQTDPRIQALPLMGPSLLAMRAFKNENEKMEATMTALQGISLGARPGMWLPYGEGISSVLQVAQPLRVLKAKFPDHQAQIEEAVAKTGRPVDGLMYVPMVGRDTFWTVFIDPITAQVLAYLPLDPF
jgi:hypothetical protein